MRAAAAVDNDEEWVRAAMTDDNLVVELLIKLHAAPPPLPRKEAAVFPLEWSVRQRRSKSVSVNRKEEKPAHRASPTTPLSWSCGGGGSEESTRQRPPFRPATNATRSKVNVEGEKTASKRSRKKKTLAELKGEEHSLWKERQELKREITALRANLERQRTTNKNLKRMKIELQPQMDRESTSLANESTSNQRKPDSAAHSHTIKQPDGSPHGIKLPLSPPSNAQFILPDLNVPFNEPNAEIISGVS